MNYSEYKYDQYNVDDWVVDEDFISYVNGDANPVIAQFEKNSKQAQNIIEAKSLINHLNHQTPFVSDDQLADIFQKVNHTIDSKRESSKPKTLTLRRLIWPAGIAAAITLLVYFLPGLQNGQEIYATNIGEKESIVLPDH